MKTRNSKTTKNDWADYPTVGMMDFMVEGYVQDIKEGDNVDYISFNIDNPYVEGNINSINVEVAWDGFPQLEKGDHVVIQGSIRSWWQRDIKKVTYSFVARDVHEVKSEPKGRRGVAKTPDEE